jgi:hypothetical protein
MRGIPRPAAAPAPAARPAAAPLPDFPWPPPQPSTRAEIASSVFKPAAGSTFVTLSGVGNQIVAALEHAKYSEYSYYRAPGGFALVARLERMAEDGTPLPGEFRFLQPGSQEPFSLALYVKQLFVAPEGYYRQIVFAASDQPFTATGAKLDAKKAQELLSGGANRLSADFEGLPFTAGHRVSALIYEFRKGPKEGDVATLTPGRLTSRAHLERAGLAASLGVR